MSMTIPGRDFITGEPDQNIRLDMHHTMTLISVQSQPDSAHQVTNGGIEPMVGVHACYINADLTHRHHCNYLYTVKMAAALIAHFAHSFRLMDLSNQLQEATDAMYRELKEKERRD